MPLVCDCAEGQHFRHVHAQVAPLFSATWEAAASQQASQEGAGSGVGRPSATPGQGSTQASQVRETAASMHSEHRC